MGLQFKHSIFAIFIQCVLFTTLHGQSAPPKVSEISIYGNKITDEKIVRMYLGIDKGEVFDSVSTIEAQKKLLETGLFSSARVFSQAVPEGIRLLVLLEERLFLTIHDIGGELHGQLHGDTSQNWWRARFGVTFDNFRGRMEKLSAHVTFWTSRSLSLSWYKPFVGTPYFMKTGFSLSYMPYKQYAYNRFALQQFTTLGRKLGSHSMLYASLIPGWYRDYVADKHSDFLPEINADPFSELLLSIGFLNDSRDHSFNSHSGHYFRTSLLTNYLYTTNHEHSYVQLSTENRLFHRGFRPKHTVGYRLRTTIRNRDAGVYNYLYAGGESTVRGYGSNGVGVGLGANNRIVFSTEYRFPIFKTPSMHFPTLGQIDSRLNSFFYQVDGAVLLDYGYLWRDMTSPRAFPHYQDAAGAGLGIRVLAPTLQRSVSFDIVWPVIRENLISSEAKWWQPGWHLYLDFPF